MSPNSRKPEGPSKRSGTQRQLRLSGSAAVLGDLEGALMEAAWSLDRPATARELYSRIVKRRRIEYITAATVLNRLVATKRLLKRQKIDDVFHYTPTVTRDEFRLRASKQVMERVMALGADAVAASVVDVLAERNPEQLAELARLVRRKLRERGR